MYVVRFTDGCHHFVVGPFKTRPEAKQYCQEVVQHGEIPHGIVHELRAPTDFREELDAILAKKAEAAGYPN